MPNNMTLSPKLPAGFRWCAAGMMMGLSCSSLADEMLHWRDAWVRSLPPGAAVTAAYGSLMNHGSDTVTIVNLTSTAGAEAQMHDVIADGDQRKMVRLNSVDIAPGESLVFEPGGRHIMLLGVTDAPEEGSDLALCALSAMGTEACTRAPVTRQAPGGTEPLGHHH
ncbi:MAG: copper chaperone PCu(A)C [Luminiphilus sp.]|nr:copper chaperone PCu(A)C [Luminiphilus sp.]